MFVPAATQLRRAQLDAGLFDQFAHPNLLGLVVLLIEIDRAALYPLVGPNWLQPLTL